MKYSARSFWKWREEQDSNSEMSTWTEVRGGKSELYGVQYASVLPPCYYFKWLFTGTSHFARHHQDLSLESWNCLLLDSFPWALPCVLSVWLPAVSVARHRQSQRRSRAGEEGCAPGWVCSARAPLTLQGLPQMFVLLWLPLQVLSGLPANTAGWQENFKVMLMLLPF